MLKKRIVACLLVKENVVVQSIGFERYLPVGNVAIAIEFLNSWGIDEIILLDIDATREGRAPNYSLIEDVSTNAFVPLTVGGGIRSVSDMQLILRAGADKISINHAAISDPNIVREGANVFGSQCIVVSMDVKLNHSGSYEIFGDSGRRPTGVDPFDFARQMQDLGAGEILLNSIDRDGAKVGYDLVLADEMASSVRIPIILCGGVGVANHLLEGIRIANISAVAAANFFHFTEHSVIIAKSIIASAGVDVRIDTYANYVEHEFEQNGRLSKVHEAVLAEMIFEYVPDEII